MDWKMIIGGKSVDASDGAVLNNYNPYTGELIGTVPAATKEDVDLAIANAVEGQKEWAALRNDERDAIINKFLALYDEHAEELAQLLSREGGKTISECRGEVGSVPLIFRAYMNAAATMYGETLPYNVERRNTSDIIFTSYDRPYHSSLRRRSLYGRKRFRVRAEEDRQGKPPVHGRLHCRSVPDHLYPGAGADDPQAAWLCGVSSAAFIKRKEEIRLETSCTYDRAHHPAHRR